MKKKIYSILLPLVCASLLFAACDSDDNSETNTNVYMSYGVIEAVGSEPTTVFGILTDSGKRLHPKSAVSAPLTDGDRVLVHYMLDEGISTDDSNQIIDIIKVVPIRVQDVLPISYYAAEYYDSLSIGVSPTNGSIINVDDIWTGGKYLNVKYRLVKRKNSDVEHYVNCMVYRAAANGQSTTVTLALCHGADNFRDGVKEVPTATDHTEFEYGPQEIISFDLSTLEYPSLSPLDILVHWDGYDGMKWLEHYVCTTVSGFTYPVPAAGQLPIQ